eukprot:CAMPEP_0206573016 /NCGR_PEP_ID=MMETSP0325_2-20121206/28597_1 /ASSEMBLY_ACC=CAM_ASM_000347 /TAXON_ID=2866 /ORGANISM="Crypthecodinium cohnii, Strain Seligo" /LENGTH=1487 /DNA_ID=CAMNT_0054077345 /DNA_START=113 /DNA_END=4576 /DNA_ORIENTATION=+
MADVGLDASADRAIALPGNADRSSVHGFASNKVTTSKYTMVSFLPKNAWEQLHKFGNVYFLLISIVMYLGEKTPLFVGTIKAFSTFGLLMMMMSITAAMAFIDDWRRKKADAEVNGTKAQVVQFDGSCDNKCWENLKVGDLLLVRKDEEFPADAVPIFCSGEGGNCYVSTANLDGESNLKLKVAPTATQSAILSKAPASEKMVLAIAADLRGQVIAEAPNRNIHDFNGSLEADGCKPESLGVKQLLMRGTVLRNTDYCLALVCYTGADTRMIRNSRPAPMKQSNLEVLTNTAMVIILLVQAVLALISAWLHVQFTPQLKEHWYIYPREIVLPEFIGWWLTFFTLYSNLMPISLYPTVEFCNAVQCYFIQNDREMYYRAPGFNHGNGFPALARSSNLCQELGQVSYIFSDKTGTLTQNDMELKRVSIGGSKFGTFVQGETGFNGEAAVQARRLQDGLVDSFLEVLAVAHTVMLTTGKNGKVDYEAESPDEYALVKAAADLGWSFSGRSGKDVTVQCSAPGERPQTLQYRILAVNEFNSTRKRMSVVVEKRGTGECWVMVKGADNVMLERAAHVQPALVQDLKEFSMEGLRTLVIGCRRLDAQELSEWQARYDTAQRETKNREEKLAAVAEDIEKNLVICGATAIEDKLQAGVPEAIEKIREAGIKLWVLTGDKLETARNIGYSTKVLAPSMDLRILDEEEGTMDLREVEKAWKAVPEISDRALMVSGKALQGFMEDDKKKAKLLQIASSSSVLIACRVSPAQKAEMVRLVREGIKPSPVTLSIGDGANDVPMIQEAQVGIGIAGKEGRQAVNNSDFAIAQFRFLESLLFVHGRWNYRRACTFTLFTFWRNMVQVLMMMYYTWVSGFSGTALYEDWIRLSFNLLCTLPILAVGCMDQDFTRSQSLEHPTLYRIGAEGLDLNVLRTMNTIVAAITHSLVLLVLAIPAFAAMEIHGNGDYYTFGTACYTCLLMDVNYRAAFKTHNHNKVTVGAICLSFIGYAFWLVAYPMNKILVNMLTPNMYWVPARMASMVYFWLFIFITPLVAMVIDVFVSFLFQRFAFDERTKIIRRIHEQVNERAYDRSKSMQNHSSEDGETCWSMDECRVIMGSTSPDSEASDSDSSCHKAAPSRMKRDINTSRFAQQCLPDVRLQGSKSYTNVCRTGVIGGTVLLVVGAGCLYMSAGYRQVRILYDENREPSPSILEQMWLGYPYGTKPEETLKLTEDECSAAPGSGEVVCKVRIRLREGMSKPLLLFAVGPIYQNYNTYMQSEVFKELAGHEVSRSLREQKCVGPTRVHETLLPDGSIGQKSIVPCGMKATSFFNDTVTVVGKTISRKNVAWPTDIQRYGNPKDYLQNDEKLFLPDMFPGVIDRELGTEDPGFAAWMRPSAVPRRWFVFGQLEEDLAPNSTLDLEIHSRYPLHNIPGGFKALALTEYGVFGGRHGGFGLFCVIFSVICLGLAALSMVLDCLASRFFDSSDDLSDDDDEESGSA